MPRMISCRLPMTTFSMLAIIFLAVLETLGIWEAFLVLVSNGRKFSVVATLARPRDHRREASLEKEARRLIVDCAYAALLAEGSTTSITAPMALSFSGTLAYPRSR